MLGLLCAQASSASAQLKLLVRTDSGEVEFWNAGTADATLAFYEITSPSFSLLPDAWTPVAGRLDATAGGGFDAFSPWQVFADEMDEIIEGAFFGPGGTLEANQLVSIGPAWSIGGSPDLLAFALAGDNTESELDVIYTPPGDYNFNGVVDGDDYNVFRETFGSTEDLRADGNGSGAVDAADYTIWRDAFAAPLPVAAARVVLAPEPSSVALVISLFGLTNGRRRKQS